MDAPLSATLQFSTPVVNTVTAWPQQQAEIHRKLKKQQKALPSFGWDTEPVIGNEEVIEASFIDAFCDLVYGGGWMDLERGEALDRDCNWALVSNLTSNSIIGIHSQNLCMCVGRSNLNASRLLNPLSRAVAIHEPTQASSSSKNSSHSSIDSSSPFPPKHAGGFRRCSRRRSPRDGSRRLR